MRNLITPFIIICIACAWIGLFVLNESIFRFTQISPAINLIFIPAGLRLISVIVFSWLGVIGLFLGGVLIGIHFIELSPLQAIILAGLSALSPFFAYSGIARVLKLNPALDGMAARDLLIIAISAALLGGALHSLFFLLDGSASTFINPFIQIFIGDLLGMLLVLYCAKFSIWAYRQIYSS